MKRKFKTRKNLSPITKNCYPGMERYNSVSGTRQIIYQLARHNGIKRRIMVYTNLHRSELSEL